MYKVMGTATVMRIACVLTLIGGWVRVLCPLTGFWVILFGQTVISCAQPLVYNVINRFCSVWFTDKERSLAASICGLSMPGGNLVAFILCGYTFRGIGGMTDAEIK
jgi:hypothetical protein